LDSLRACIRDWLLPASQQATIPNAPGNAKVAAYRPVVGRSSVKFHRTFMTGGDWRSRHASKGTRTLSIAVTAMTQFRRFSGTKDVLGWSPAGAPHDGGTPFASRLAAIGRWIGDCAATLAEYYEATTVYEQLSRLSDAELRRRGLSRADLARDALAILDRTMRRD
jgi:hypothetical protein